MTNGAWRREASIVSDLFANVKTDFGAVGDGSADDSAAVQAALRSRAHAVFFPDGTYLVQGLIIGSGKKLWGNGRIKGIAGQNILAIHGDDSTIDGLTFIGGGAVFGLILYGKRNTVSRCRFSGDCSHWIAAQYSFMTTVDGNSIDGSSSLASDTPIVFSGVQNFICTGNSLFDTQGFGIQAVCLGPTRTFAGTISNNIFYQPQYTQSVQSTPGQRVFHFSLEKPAPRYGIQVNGLVAPGNSHTIATSDSQHFTVTFATPPPASSAVTLIGYRALECININSWAYDISIVGNILHGSGDSGIVLGSDYHNGVLDPGHTTFDDFPARVSISANTIRQAGYAGIAINAVAQGLTITANNISGCGVLSQAQEFSTGIHTGYPSTSIVANAITNTSNPPTMTSGLSLLAATPDDGKADKTLKIAANSFAGYFPSKISLLNGGPHINQGVTISDEMATQYPERPNLDAPWTNAPANTPYFTYTPIHAGWNRDPANILGGTASLQTVAGSHVAITPTARAIMQDTILKIDLWAIAQSGKSFVELWTDFNGNPTLITRLILQATTWQQYTLTAAMQAQVNAKETEIRIGAITGSANIQHINLSTIRIPDKA